MRGDERIGIKGFLNRDAANEGRDFAGNFVEAAEHDLLAGGFHSGTLQYIAQARTGETGGAHRSLSPLHAGNLWTLQATAVSGALECVDDGVSLQFRKVCEAQGERLVYLSAE